MALALSPGAARAQLNLDLGGTVESVGSTVGDTVESLSGTVDGVGNAAASVLGGDRDATGSSANGSGSAPASIITLDQNAALELVRSNRALPLERIMSLARLEIDGEIVDAHLIQVRGFLLYELKVVDADGDVSDIYYYARSGERVRTN
jgi:uncharacterized membrane protein YkoI